MNDFTSARPIPQCCKQPVQNVLLLTVSVCVGVQLSVVKMLCSGKVGGGGGRLNLIVYTEYCIALPDRCVSVFCLDSSCGQKTASQRCMNLPSQMLCTRKPAFLQLVEEIKIKS